MTAEEHHLHYCSDNIHIFCGDFFDFKEESVNTISAIYDTSALTALPRPMRVQYAEKLTRLSAKNCRILLNVFETEAPLVSSCPPFPVDYTEVMNLFGPAFEITLLESKPIETPPRLKKRGYLNMQSTLYLLKRM